MPQWKIEKLESEYPVGTGLITMWRKYTFQTEEQNMLKWSSEDAVGQVWLDFMDLGKRALPRDSLERVTHLQTELYGFFYVDDLVVFSVTLINDFC